MLLQILVYKEIIAVRYRAVKEKNLTLFRTLNWYFLAITLFYFYAQPAAKFLWATSIISKEAYQLFHHYHLWISFCLYIIGKKEKKKQKRKKQKINFIFSILFIYNKFKTKNV